MTQCEDCCAPHPDEECDECMALLCWRCARHQDGLCVECCDALDDAYDFDE